jgi:hypothetical protein
MAIFPVQFKTPAAVTVTTDATTILEVDLSRSRSLVNVEIHNSGAAALTAFVVQVKDHPEGEWYQLLAAYADTSKTVRYVVGAPATLAGGAKAHIGLLVNAPVAIRFRATCGTSTTVLIYGNAANYGD